LSTAAVYGVCRIAETIETMAPLMAALRRGDLRQVGRCLHNRLQGAAQHLSPWIPRLQQEFSRLDFLGHGMSGSGTSYFGLCRNACHAKRMGRRLQSRDIGCVLVVRSCP
jgi:4-diphosphocytidyl-2-C-methyl-D-erythritol kinase